MRARRVGRSVRVALVVSLTLLAAACTDTPDDDESAPPATVTVAPEPAELTFGVYGDQDELAAYRRVADSYNAVNSESNVSVEAYSDVEELTAAVESGTVPDVFLMSRDDLGNLSDQGLTRPLSDLLDERGVDIGDAYSRDALEAFSVDRDLQCMPYGTSPDVVFYNKRWVDFDRMAARGLPTPTIDPEDPRQAPRWSLEMYAAAADFATRPRRGVSGMYVDPTLRGLAPFIYSGGGQVFDDDDEPTSLAFSDDDTRDALGDVLPLLRDARLTLTADQLAEASPTEWFERGKVAMVVGTRSLVPELRAVDGLDFDVLPLPVVGEDATVGDITGICLSGKSRDAAEAADFLVHAISADSVRQVVEAGDLVPANQTVALSDAFLEPGELPVHSSVFVASVRSMVLAPLLRDRQALDDAVTGLVGSLVTSPDLLGDADVEQITTEIDEASRTVLAPQEDPGSGESEAPADPSEDDAG